MHPAGNPLDEKQHVDGFQKQRLDRKEVAGEDLAAVPGQAAAPSAPRPSALRRRRHRLSPEDVAYGGAPDGIPKLSQLPAWIRL